MAIKTSNEISKKVERPVKMLHKKDIISIIQSCYRNGVSELKFAGMELRFHPQTSLIAPPPIQRSSKVDERISVVTETAYDEAKDDKLMFESPTDYEQQQLDQLGS